MAERAAQEASRWSKINSIANSVGKMVGDSMEAKAAEDERYVFFSGCFLAGQSYWLFPPQCESTFTEFHTTLRPLYSTSISTVSC